MKNIVVATIKSWNIENFKKIRNKDYNWILIDQKKDLNYDNLKSLDPKYVFFPHWSWIIPANIHENFNCVVFHMTDLPFGRGGSPLQNLISRGIYKTKISAIKVAEGLDAGDIYMKRDLDLSEGNAEEIFKRASDIVFKMIEEIVKKDPKPVPQTGEVVEFKRRTPKESEIPADATPDKVHDWIRMLDAEGYPRAFIVRDGLRYEFFESKKGSDHVESKVIIKRADENEK